MQGMSSPPFWGTRAAQTLRGSGTARKRGEKVGTWALEEPQWRRAAHCSLTESHVPQRGNFAEVSFFIVLI